MHNLTRISLVLFCFVFLFSTLSYAQNINDIISSRINPLTKSRTYLSKLFQKDFFISSQLLFTRNIQENIKGIGQGQKIFIGRKHAATKIPIFLKNSSAFFIIVDSFGNVIDIPSIKVPDFHYFLIPDEWKITRRTPIVLSEQYFNIDSIQGEIPPFPVKSSLRNGYMEYFGVEVNPSELKEFYILPGSLDLPVKNIEENSLTLSKLQSFTNIKGKFSGKPRISPLASMAASAATTADWWKIAGSGSREIVFNHYISSFNNDHEYGIDPWFLYTEYINNSRKDSESFPLCRLFKDDILNNSPPSSLHSYAELIQPLLAGSRKPVKLFDNHMGNFDLILKSLRENGIILGGIAPRMSGIPMNFSLFGISIIGAGKIKGQEVLLYRDCYGKGEKEIHSGGPLFRVIPVAYVKEAWQFPHEFELKIDYSWKTETLHAYFKIKDGNATDPGDLEAFFLNENKQVYFTRDSLGKFSFKLPRSFLKYDQPQFRIRVMKNFFSSANSKWMEKIYTVR